jgi:hypothetical protein
MNWKSHDLKDVNKKIDNSMNFKKGIIEFIFLIFENLVGNSEIFNSSVNRAHVVVIVSFVL